MRRRRRHTPTAAAPAPTCLQSQLNGGGGDAAKLGAALGDIRLDEDYDRFYRAQVGAGAALRAAAAACMAHACAAGVLFGQCRAAAAWLWHAFGMRAH